MIDHRQSQVCQDQSRRPRRPGSHRAFDIGAAALALMFALLMTSGTAPVMADTKPSTALTTTSSKRSIAPLSTATVPKGAPTSKRPALVLPSSTGEAKTARQTVVKERTKALSTPVPHPGKIVGGSDRPAPRTIVTKRIYPQ